MDCLAQRTPPTSLGYFEALEAGYLFEYAVGELAFWTVVAAVVKGSELAAMLAERLAQIREVRGLTREPVAVLRQHRRDAPVGHEIPHGVHSGPLQATAALHRVRHLIKVLVAITGSVAS
jgi:hypothetical protein